MTDAPPETRDFIRQIIAEDLASGRHATIVTRFPPEPNGYLHVGHAKSICLNFGVAAETGGRCILRLDDTNPLKEDQAFVDGIVDSVHWLGFDWGDHLTHASDYFSQIHECALALIESGKAYIDSLTQEQMREHRGTLTAPGRDSPHRSRSVAENRDLFARMRAGEFADGLHVLRAKIDMASPNINLRDPVLYRVRRATHQRTGDTWCIYPMYDFAHTISDAIEGITHSLCTLEFEDHRPLYEWILANLNLPAKPRQIEFSRLNLAFTITSKRKLAELIQLGHMAGWDDPRMPTIAGMRRRGYPAEALRDFASRVGVTKKEHIIQMSLLENCVRENLNVHCDRAMAVLKPLKIVLTNYPDGQTEMLSAVNHPDHPEQGERQLPFGRELLIEQDDFMENAPKKFFRLQPGGEVRLRYGYIIKCVDVRKDADGRVTEVHCTYDPDTRSGLSGAARKVKGTIHWVSAAHAVPAEIRLFDRLFAVSRPDGEDADFKTFLNPDSLRVEAQARLEPSLAAAAPGTVLQFERLGYFVADIVDHSAARPVFNRVVSLRDSWAKIEAEAT